MLEQKGVHALSVPSNTTFYIKYHKWSDRQSEGLIQNIDYHVEQKKRGTFFLLRVLLLPRYFYFFYVSFVQTSA